MELSIMNLVELFISAFISVMVASLWHFMSKSVKKQADAMRAAREQQEEANKLAVEFRRSMQRAEIIRYFRIVVEQGKPITPEELGHVESCYKAYHKEGGNGTVTVMYKKIIANVILITSVKDMSDEEDK